MKGNEGPKEQNEANEGPQGQNEKNAHKGKKSKNDQGPGQLNFLCKNATLKGRPGNLWGGPHRPAPKKAK